MTSTTSTTTNGKPRKQLSDQLDRLDSIIDALADALPEAVADACREGAKQAVKDAVAELLASPELRSLIAGLAAARVAPPPAPAVPAPASPGIWDRLKATFAALKSTAAARCRTATASVTAAARTLTAVMPLRQVVAVGAGVGVAVGVVSYVCPHAVSAAIGGVCAAGTAVAAQVGVWLRRSASLFGFGTRT